MSSNRRPFDKVEKSPTSQATCKLCNQKIAKGDWRIGRQYYLEQYEKWTCKYYHRSCVEENEHLLKKMNFAPSVKKNRNSKSKRKLEDILCTSNKDHIQTEIDKIDDSESKRHKLVHDERHSLREELRQMRLQFSEQKDVPVYFIFNNLTLDAIVEAMPTDKFELLQINGIGPKKVVDFGPSILSIVNSYKRANASSKCVTVTPEKGKSTWESSEEDDEDNGEMKKALREDLWQLRLKFSRGLGIEAYYIFCNTTLDELVEKMPCNKSELRKIKGIGPDKLAKFGSSILSIIESYKRSHSSKPMKKGKSIWTDDDGEGKEVEVEVEKEMTIDEIVEQRFKDAEENGNVIEL